MLFECNKENFLRKTVNLEYYFVVYNIYYNMAYNKVYRNNNYKEALDYT